MSRVPRWLRIAVPVAVVVIAISVIAVVAAAGNDDDVSSSPPRKDSSTTSAPASTTPAPTSTSSPATPSSEPAPPGTDPISNEPPAPGGTVTARIVLPVTAMAAGSTLSGTVIVENSGAEFQVTSCGDYFKLFLTNEHGLNKEAPRRLCDTTSMTIPTGTSSYPVTLSASYEYCDEVTGTGYFECLPDGSPEPLPADDYRAVLLQASNPPVPIVADPVAVTVTNG